MRRVRVSLLLVWIASACGACDARQTHALDSTKAQAALQTYAAIAAATYADSATSARALSQAIATLLAKPAPASLADARRAWLQARVPYAQTEVFRFYDGPIDAVERWINTWPIDENYIEADGTSGRLGLIEDRARYPELSAAVLEQLNMRDGETSVSTGFHVIEYLLWGRDDNPNGPGDRPYTDFVVSEATSAAAIVERRRSYLTQASALLLAQLEQVARAWSGGDAKAYRARFLALSARGGLGLAVKGMGSLSGPELSGERLTVPYETKDQENEHSCFSDSTLADLRGDALGIQNVCLGRYRRQDGSVLAGAGLCAALRTLAPSAGERLVRQTSDSLAALEAIPAPFDRAITGDDTAPGRRAIAAAIRALQDQTDTLTGLAQLLHVGLGGAQASAP